MTATFLQRWVNRWQRKRPNRARRAVPRLELLEDRSLLSHGPGVFRYELLATLGDAAPGGGRYVFDFEPYEINNNGQILYGADLLNEQSDFS